MRNRSMRERENETSKLNEIAWPLLPIEPKLDRVVLYELSIVHINDMEKLQRSGYLIINELAKKKASTISGQSFYRLKLPKSDYYHSFFCGVSESGFVYSRMELVVSPNPYGNLYGRTVTELKIDLLEAINEIRIQYGVVVDVTEAKIDCMEICKTVRLNGVYVDYAKSAEIIMKQPPFGLRLRELVCHGKKEKNKKSITGRSYYFTSFKASSGTAGLTIKLYEKSIELKEKYGIIVPYSSLRFEITLNSPTKITRELLTNNLADMTDEMIADFFNEFVRENILTSYSSTKEKYKDYFTKLLRNNYKKGSEKWVLEMIAKTIAGEVKDGVPVIFSAEEFAELLLKAFPGNDNNTTQMRSRAKKKILAELKKGSYEEFDVKYSGCMEEILNKIGVAFSN